MHSHGSTATANSSLETSSSTRSPGDWLPVANRLACIVFLTAVFLYFRGIPVVSYEVGSGILVGAWCVGLRSMFRRFWPAAPVAAAMPAVVTLEPERAQEAARGGARDAARSSAVRVVPITNGARNEREGDGDRMRPAV